MALRKPPLREAHAERGATFTEFGGWDMPVEFDSITAEHRAVRDGVGKFDVSHMGEIEVGGPDATELLQRLTTNDVTELDPGDAQYSMITDENGIILDDTLVYRLPESAPFGRAAAGERYLFVPNAGHDVEFEERWTDHRDGWGLDATVRNVTDEWAMFAIQGPEAPTLVADCAAGSEAPGDLGRFEASDVTVAGIDCWIARTGYTGEDGFELLCPWTEAETVWTALECQPCGLGARDTLRMEMGFLLSGQDFDPETEPRTPYEAGVDFTVDLTTEFVGRDALRAVSETGVEETFVGVKLQDRGVPRHGYEIVDEGESAIGHLTSGTMSPTLDEPIGLGYLSVDYADPGTRVDVVIRGRQKRATVTSLPFIDR